MGKTNSARDRKQAWFAPRSSPGFFVVFPPPDNYEVGRPEFCRTFKNPRAKKNAPNKTRCSPSCRGARDNAKKMVRSSALAFEPDAASKRPAGVE